MDATIRYFKSETEEQDWKTAFLTVLAHNSAFPAAIADMYVTALRERREPIALFNVDLTGLGSNRVTLVKALRAHSALGLKEAVGICEWLTHPVTPRPYRLAQAVTLMEASLIADKFRSVGAPVDLHEVTT